MSVTAIALPRTVADLVAEYEEKDAALASAISAHKAAHEALCGAASVNGAFVSTIVQEPHVSERDLRAKLLSSGWQAAFNRLNIQAVASAKDLQLFKRAIADPPPFTLENVKATFGDYLVRPRFHILKGLAEAFTALDPAYKSHSKVRMGVKGLPKRVIFTGWNSFGCSYARDQFRDMVNALATYQGKPHLDYAEQRAIDQAHRNNEDAVLDGRAYFQTRYNQTPERLQTVDRGLTVRSFQNGNAHVFFDKWAMFDINKALGEFYGEVLPDAEPEGVKPSASTAVSADLQFYWSPPAVVRAACDLADIGYPKGQRVLEPSCGDGRIMDEIRERGGIALGFEYHPGRAAQARAKGHAVVTGNFLEQQPTADFDTVVMNPPFSGRHYVKHVRHALRFLRPGGTLVAILPATARYDHGELQGDWQDLPVASFAEAGTNVPTTMLRLRMAA